ncbi:MAG TPA: type II secretion system F family protein [Candidatus Limnocylindrales bacterium]|nr:type II secretion system F family protein [Candidatus Limnocylindrales bacterium]
MRLTRSRAPVAGGASKADARQLRLRRRTHGAAAAAARRRPVSRREAAAAIARIAALTASGMTTSEAIASSARGGNVCLTRLNTAVQRGTALSAAMQADDLPFRDVEVAVVRAGEAGGAAARALMLLASQMEQQSAGARRLVSALSYPCLLVAGALAALAFLSISVLPAFTSLYSDRGAELPATTRMLLAFGVWVQRNAIVVAAWLAAAVGAAAVARARSRRCRRLFDLALLRLPVLRGLTAPRQLHSACALIAVLLDAGCELEEALRLAASAADNSVISGRLSRCLRSLRRGAPMSRCWNAALLDRSGDATALLEIAEATGDYASAFTRLAALEGAAADHALSRLCRLAEPAAVVVMAAAVGGGVMALYQPMLGSASLLLGGTS